MDQDRLLSLFLQVINYFVQWISATQHCLFVIELGFQHQLFFQYNIGSDLVHKIYVKCCSNNLQQHKETTELMIEKPFIIHEKCFCYNMTPFDLRYRVFHLSEHVDNKYRYILRKGDSYFLTVYNIIVFFNTSTGRLGIACDIENARKEYRQKHNANISDFFLIHQCCLIIHDLCLMIEETISPIDCSLTPLSTLPEYHSLETAKTS